MSDLLSRAADRIRRWRESPATMVREEFQAEPDPHQLELLAAFADPAKRRIAMKAAKGPGKTTGLAWCGLNFLACYGTKGSHPNGAAVSITGDNLRDNLWKEFAKWMGRSKFFSAAFTWTKSMIFANDHPATWFISARGFSKNADQQQQSETLAGLHADNLLFLLDESGGMPRAIMATAEAGLTAPWGKIVQAGNPTNLDGPLYDACTTNRDMWHLIIITGDPDNPKRATRIPIQWAREQIKLYGPDNPWVRINVFGEFPAVALNALLGPDDVEAAMKRKYRDEDFRWAQKRLGVDVARFGDDRTVLFPRQGLQAFRPVQMRGARTTEIYGRIMLTRKRWLPELITIDDTGNWGNGVVDLLHAARAKNVIPVVFSDPGINKRYKNRRAEMWIELAEWVKRGGALPFMPEMTKELTAPTYSFTADGKMVLESKDQIKERLGYSPDLADGLALTFALAEMPGQLSDSDGLPFGARKELEETGHHWEYDPLEAGR